MSTPAVDREKVWTLISQLEGLRSSLVNVPRDVDDTRRGLADHAHCKEFNAIRESCKAVTALPAGWTERVERCSDRELRAQPSLSEGTTLEALRTRISALLDLLNPLVPNQNADYDGTIRALGQRLDGLEASWAAALATVSDLQKRVRWLRNALAAVLIVALLAITIAMVSRGAESSGSPPPPILRSSWLVETSLRDVTFGKFGVRDKYTILVHCRFTGSQEDFVVGPAEGYSGDAGNAKPPTFGPHIEEKRLAQEPEGALEVSLELKYPGWDAGLFRAEKVIINKPASGWQDAQVDTPLRVEMNGPNPNWCQVFLRIKPCLKPD